MRKSHPGEMNGTCLELQKGVMEKGGLKEVLLTEGEYL